MTRVFASCVLATLKLPSKHRKSFICFKFCGHYVRSTLWLIHNPTLFQVVSTNFADVEFCNHHASTSRTSVTISGVPWSLLVFCSCFRAKSMNFLWIHGGAMQVYKLRPVNCAVQHLRGLKSAPGASPVTAASQAVQFSKN